MKTYELKKIYIPFLYTSLFFIYYILFLNQGFHSPGPLGHFDSDLGFHIQQSQNISHHFLDSLRKDFEPLSHILIAVFAGLFSLMGVKQNTIAYANAAAFVLSFAKLAQFLIIEKIVRENTDLTRKKAIFLTIIINFCSTLFIPFINSYTYIPFGSPNTSHNPTSLVLAPLAIAFFYFYIKYYIKENSQTQKSTLYLTLLLILATLCKPSFTNIILVVVAIHYLIKPKRFLSGILIHDLIIFVPSCIILIIQLILIHKYTNDSSLLYAPFKVIRYYAPHHPYLTLFQALEFPLLITLVLSLKEKSSFQTYSSYAWLFTLIAYSIFTLFSFKGSKWTDANLIWSCNIGLLILYTFVIIDYINFLNEKNAACFRFNFLNTFLINKIIVNVCMINLSLIFLCGIYRFIKIFLGGSFL